jgi:superfamily II DNA or RNA helicase
MIQLRHHQEKAVSLLREYNRGQVIVPTGGGKTLIAITDAKQQLQDSSPKTIVVVAPRILLAEQLCSEFMEVIDPHNSDPYLHILHVHSGETHYTSTTNVDKINVYANCARNMGENCIIFTTYHSLHRIMEADIEVNTIYFDEAHNSVQRNFFPATEYFSNEADRCYFFTATPKHSLTINKPGMNDGAVYGKVLCDIPAPELIDHGIILPPKVVVKRIDMPDDSRNKYEHDCDNLLATLDEIDVDKVLICARATKQIVGLASQTKFCNELQSRGYNWMYITSKTGAIINGTKTTRENFFDTLNKWGKDSNCKFVVLHHSILSEGINVKGLEAALFLRNMDYVGISQTIGRVIRKGDDTKTYGLVVIPAADRVGISTAKRVNAVVNTIFNEGKAAVSTIRR